ncbi:MAG: DEAD/DEAH box helicase [Polyangiales bacterium]
MPFSALGLSPALAQSAAALGFVAPTPVQSAAIPVVLRGDDLLATAQTGSGKTAAFALPLLQRGRAVPPTAGARRACTLVLVPTRELAAQVGEVFRRLAQPLSPRPRVAVAFGGVSINPQMIALRGGTDVVVATPGRLLDLVDHRALRLDAIEHLVLDEADRLLDLGFADELTRVLGLVPVARQTLLFSATFAPEVEALAGRILRAPTRVDTPVAQGDAAVIAQRVFEVDEGRRAALLLHLRKAQGWARALVFVASQHTAEHLAARLRTGGVAAAPFHGGLSQGARTQALRAFNDARWDVLVTTDLAARGLHIEGLPVVVNYDLPRSPEDHTHRIGRTGRAGERGLAVTFVTPASEAHWRLIEKRQGLSVPRERAPGFEPTWVAPTIAPAAGGTGGVKGKRMSKKDKARLAAR